MNPSIAQCFLAYLFGSDVKVPEQELLAQKPEDKVISAQKEEPWHELIEG